MQKIKPKNEISCQYYYIIKFDNQVRNTMKKDQIGKKKQKGKSMILLLYNLALNIIHCKNKLRKQEKYTNYLKRQEQIRLNILKHIVRILFLNYPIVNFKLLLIISPRIPILNYPMIKKALLLILKRRFQMIRLMHQRQFQLR